MMKALLLAGLLLSQQDPATRGTLSPPLLGYAFDPAAGTLRPLYGIPGASLAGNAVELEAKLSAAVAAPEQNLLIGVTAERSAPVVMIPSRGSLAARPLANASPGADRIALSPSGTAAVLASSSERWIEVITGMPDTFTVTRRTDGAGLTFSPELLAVSDDGQIVLAAASGAAFVWLGPDGQAHDILTPSPSALAFRARSHDAVFVTSGTDQNWLVLDIGGQIGYQPLPAYGAAQTAVAVEFSHDGQRFYVANTSGGVAQFDLQGGAPEVVSCSCSPTGLVRLRGNSIFLLNGGGSPPLFLLDGDSARPRLWFVPPDGGDQ